MKNIALFFFLFLVTGVSVFAQMGINTDNSQPDPSAMLDVKSTSKGFLPPRVALTAINSALPVAAPVVGLFVYNTATAGTAPNNVTPGYYSWNGTRWAPVAPPQGTNVGDMLYWNGMQWVSVPVGTNGQILTLINGVPVWSSPSSLCGMAFTVNHVAGAVAPVSKTVTYGTVTNIPGEPAKCWITSNLGADHQAAAVNDATEASAGWYWQFNRKQGYKNDGATLTPNTGWITSIIENTNWVAANDPCAIELGTGWRVPSYVEWTNVDAGGGWTDWNIANASALKLHAAGYLLYWDGSLTGRGSNGNYWSGTQYDPSYTCYLFFNNVSCFMYNSYKALGIPVRCVRDY